MEKESVDLRSVFAHVPGNNVLLLPDSPTYTIIGVSDNYLKSFNKAKEELLGKGLFDAFRDHSYDLKNENEKTLRSSFEYVIQHKEAQHLPLRRYDLFENGGKKKETYLTAINQPIINESGEVVYLVHHVEDVTTKIITDYREEKLKNIERINRMFMQAPVAVCIVSCEEYRVELANDQMLRLLGRTPDMIGKRIEESLTEARLQGLIAILDEVRTTAKSYHTPSFPATLLINGIREERFFDLLFEPYYESLEDREPTGIFCVGYNVTQQVLAQKKLEELQRNTEQQKRLLETITSNTPDLIYVFDKNYRITYANAALLAMWGTSWENSIGKGLESLGYEPWHVEMHKREIDQVIATKKPIRGEVSFPHAILGKRSYDYIFVPVFNENGEVESVAGTTRDITELKQAEDILKESSEKLEAQVAERTLELERSNKDLEDFAYAASHDMKEPIRKIQYFSDRLKEQLHDQLSNEQKRFFERMESASKRMGTLIDDLLSYSQATRGIPDLQDVDLNKKVQQVLTDLEIVIEQKQADIKVDQLPSIKANSLQMQQLFQNLVSNALKYSKDDVPPRIHITCKKMQGKDAGVNLPGIEKEKKYYFIQVSDNGIGFSNEDAERIFNMFTRLHGINEYSGSGIGLSIAKKVVQNHDGFIWADSEPEVGSSFKVLLPA